ncbi:MAG: beta-lactamase family protein [Alcanivoracaceae bacterium]|nr:beta-lactamase family protein [Alcanivoracaceae bacterium]
MKKLLKIVLYIIIILALIYLLLPTQKNHSSQANNIDDYIEAVMNESAIPGMAIAVIKNNKVILSKGYGYANVTDKQNVSEHTPFNIASLSKPILGISLLQLVDMGFLNLDEDINKYLPFKIINPKVTSRPITIRHLATHTSGINDYYDESSYAINKDSDVSLLEHVKRLLTPDGKLYAQGKYFSDNSAGSNRDYSNLGAGVAGLVLESLMHESLGEFSMREIFLPLGMNNTGWMLADFKLNELATRYSVKQCIPYLKICADANSAKSNHLISLIFNPPFENKEFIAYPHYGNPQYPDGNINTSVYDLSLLLQSLFNQARGDDFKLLNKESLIEMFKLQLPAELSTRQRFFWRDNQLGLTGHTGSDLGIFSSIYFDIEKQHAVIILMNRDVDSVTARAMNEIRIKLFEL